MTDETNEIICECGHEIDWHYISCQHKGTDGKLDCACDMTSGAVYRSRISALEAGREADGETIKKLYGVLESIEWTVGGGGWKSCPSCGAFQPQFLTDKGHLVDCKLKAALLAATVPTEETGKRDQHEQK